MMTVEEIQDQPIWVEDLLAWMKKIKGQDAENFAERVKEVLTELPGQGLPEEYWAKAQEISKSEKLVQQNEGESLFLSDEDRTQLQQELKMIEEIKDENSRVKKLDEFISKILTDDLQILQDALNAAKAIEWEQHRSRALCIVVSKIPEYAFQLFKQFLDAIQLMEKERWRSQAIVAFAETNISDSQLLKQALDIAQEISDERWRYQSIQEVTSKIGISDPKLLQQVINAAYTFKQRETVALMQAVTAKIFTSKQLIIKQALITAHTINERWKPQAIASLAVQFTFDQQSSLLEQAQKATDEISNKVWQLQALTEIASKFPSRRQSLLQQALNLDPFKVIANEKIANEKIALQILIAIIEQLSNNDNNELLQQTLNYIQNIASEESRSQGLKSFVAKCPHQMIKKVLEITLSFLNENWNSEVLVSIANAIPSSDLSLLSETLQYARLIINKEYLLPVLYAIAVKSSDEQRQSLLEETLQIVESIDDQKNKSQILVTIGAKILEFEPSRLNEILDIFEKINDKYLCCQSLVELSTILALSKNELSKEILLIAQGFSKDITDKDWQLRASVNIAIQFPQNELREEILKVLYATQSVDNDLTKFSILVQVVKHLNHLESEILKQVIKLALSLEDKDQRVKVLAEIDSQYTEFLILQCPQNKISTILEILPKRNTSAEKAQLLSALAPCLTVGLFPRALQLLQTEITNPIYQAESIGNLAPYLPPAQLSEAIDLVEKLIFGFSAPTNAFCEIIPYLSITQTEKVLQVFEKRLKYPELQIQILQAIASQINATANLYPKKDDALCHPLIPILLKKIEHYLINEKNVAEILVSLVPNLENSDKDCLSKIYIILNSFKSEFYCAQVIDALANSPRLSYQSLECFLNLVEKFRQEIPKSIAIRNFVSNHPNNLSSTIKSSIKELKNSKTNSVRNIEIVIIFATRLCPKYQPDIDQLTDDQIKVLRLIRQQSRSFDADKVKFLVKISPSLINNQIVETQTISQELKDPYYRAQSLIALSYFFPQCRPETERQINQVKNKKAKKAETGNLSEEGVLLGKYFIQYIELLGKFCIVVPEQIPTLIKTIEEWSAKNPFNPETITADPSRKNYKRTLILKALKPHLPIRLSREIDRETSIGKAPQDLWERSLFVLRNEYRQALKSGSLRNDAAQNEDLLDIKDEINALTEMLLMRDLTPPVAVGILGGWGGGKSYIMHLMQTHMVEIRSRGLDPIEAWGLIDENETTPDNNRLNRYVGHIYQIKFDAWTYAKSDLWASLMQTIFFELDRQISLEHQIQSALNDAKVPQNALASQSSAIWEALYDVSDEDRKWFLKNVLTKESFKNWEKISQGESNGTRLWSLFATAQTKAESDIQTKQSLLKEKKESLQELQKSPTAYILDTKDKRKVLFDTVSKQAFSLLEKRLGKSITDEITEKFTEIDATTGQTAEFYNLIKTDITNILYDKDSLIDRKLAIEFFRKNWLFVLCCILFLVATIYLPTIFFPPSIAQIVTGVAPLLSAIPIAQALLAKAKNLYNGVKIGISDFTQQLEQNIQHEIDTELSSLKEDITKLEKAVEKKSADLPINTYASIADFVKDRVQKGGYQEHLGMMHQVKEDLTMLSKRLLPPPADSSEYAAKVKQLAEVFPRGPARVVLYIDDLDRCPPDTVVQVLEAVQLLVKNPLFIAVLAIDERYITRALADHYKGVLPLQGRPSASDYLEKIIQIPYRLRPIAKAALKKYLKAQVIVQDSETSGTKFNEFSPEEFELLVECCQESELSARSLKRLTNVYKLYKVLSRTRGKKPTQKEQKSILTLLAFSSRYPDLMRDILQKIGTVFEQDRDSANNEKPLNDVFTEYLNAPQNGKNSYLSDDIEQLKNDVDKLVKDLKLKDIKEIFDFVRTFSFVGDIGVDHTNSDRV